MSDLEKKFESALNTGSISHEIARSDRLFNILSSKTFYGDLNSSQRGLGGTYRGTGLPHYRASSDVLMLIADFSSKGDQEATIAAALVWVLDISIPDIVWDNFSGKFWEILSKISEIEYSERGEDLSLGGIVASLLSVSQRRANQILRKHSEWIKKVLKLLSETSLDLNEERDHDE